MEATMPNIPIIDTSKYPITIGFVPQWVVAISVIALNGINAQSGLNAIGCDEHGNLILYRKVSEADRLNFPLLTNVEEVWFTYEFPIQD